MKVSVRQFRLGEISWESADLVVDSDSLLVRTHLGAVGVVSRLILPAGGVSDVQQFYVPCYEHFDASDSCFTAGHIPVAGYGFRAKDSTGSDLSFAVQDPQPARAVLNRASGGTGPNAVVTWQSPWDWFAFFWVGLIALWLLGAVLLFANGVWDSFHLDQVNATVTDNSQDGDNGRVCDLAWLEGDGTVEFENLSCTEADEKGTQITVWWWSGLWDKADYSLWGLLQTSALWAPLLVTGALAVAMFVFGLLLAIPFWPLANAVDRRQIRRAILARALPHSYYYKGYRITNDTRSRQLVVEYPPPVAHLHVEKDLAPTAEGLRAWSSAGQR